MHTLRPKFRLLLCLAICSWLIGCGLKTSVDGDIQTFYHDPKGTAAVMLGGVVLAIAGWFVGYLSQRFGFAMMAMGVFSTLLIAPAMMFEKGVVSKDEFSYSSSFLGLAHANVKLDDLNAIYIETTVTTRNGNDTYADEIICISNDGTETTFHFNNAVQQAACFLFLRNAKSRGIPIDKRGWVMHKKTEPWP